MSVKVNVVGGAMVNASKLAPIVADKGDTGPSAYQLWLNAGHSGTEAAYLASLKSTTAGSNGWSPALAGEADGTRTLIKVVDWTGGDGTKPAVGMYIGTAGYVQTKAEAFNFNAIKRVVPMSAVTNASGVATFNLTSLAFAAAPSIVCLPATMTVLSGTSRSVVTGTTTKTQAQVKVDQAALLTGVVTLLVGATANILVIET
jgi:hypothetical protein